MIVSSTKSVLKLELQVGRTNGRLGLRRGRGKRSASAFPQDPSTTAMDSLNKTTSSDWVPSTDRRGEAWMVAILEGSRC